MAVGTDTPVGDGKTTLIDAWDYKGRPAERATTGGWISCAMALVVELNERLTTLGIAVNLVTYLTGVMHLGNATSANTVTNFLGASFMLCLLGGFLADTFLGRYLTIGIFTAVQALGVTILTISTVIPSLRPKPCDSHGCPQANGTQITILYTALYLTALGTGGLKSSVSGFGSDQFDEFDKKERAQMTGFFNWFFFFISLGSLLAVTVLVYIQDNVGRDWGYGICAVSIVLGLVIFLSGTRKYRFKKLHGSPLTQLATVLVSAWRKKSMDLPADSSLLFDVDHAEVQDEQTKLKHKLPHSKQFRFLDKAAIKDSKISASNKWYLSTLTDVEEVKMVIRMTPIWATTIMFWTIYAQMTTFSVSQATTMDRHMGKNFEIPSGSLTAFFVAGILVTVPIYDKIVAPICRRVTKNPKSLTPLQRIGVGLVLSIFAMIAAALVEIKRINVAKDLGVTGDAKAVLPMTVFWLIPQFLLVGSGEALAYTGQLDFFLRECPKGMKTMSTGMFLTTLSLGCFFSSFLVFVVHQITGDKNPWLSDNMNEGKLYNFYWLLAVLSVVNFVVYMFCANWYVYRVTHKIAEDGTELEELEDEEFTSHA